MKRNSILIGTLLLVTLGVPTLAQEHQANTPPAEKPLSQATAYRVVVQLHEFEGEKRINIRSYDFIARPGEFTNFRNGLRVPVPGSKEETSSGSEAGVADHDSGGGDDGDVLELNVVIGLLRQPHNLTGRAAPPGHKATDDHV